MTDIFISYSKPDREEVQELADRLAGMGYAVWWDASLVPTGAFSDEIRARIDAARAVIVIWSAESIGSKWVNAEARRGDRQDKLVNTHSRGFADLLEIPMPFDGAHCVPVDDLGRIEQALGRLRVPRSATAARPRAGQAAGSAASDNAQATDSSNAVWALAAAGLAIAGFAYWGVGDSGEATAPQDSSRRVETEIGGGGAGVGDLNLRGLARQPGDAQGRDGGAVECTVTTQYCDTGRPTR